MARVSICYTLLLVKIVLLP